jgi:hypothetical protein
MLAQFQHTIANRITVTKITGLQAFEADANLGLRLFVSKRLQPSGYWLSAIFSLVSEDLDHGSNVAYKLLIIKRAYG